MNHINNNYSNCVPQWAIDMDCAVTVCDADFRIIFMNKRSRDTFAEGTDRLIGADMLACHPPRAQEIIRRLALTGGTNAYTIEKKGLRKLIFQTPWRLDDGTIGGLVELSMVIPADMPHYVRS